MTTSKSTATSKPKTTKTDLAAVPPLTILTVEMAEQARAEREQIRHLELTATRPGAYAKVRLIDLNDSNQLMALPPDELRRVLAMVNTARVYSERPAMLEDGSLDVERAVQLAQADAETRDAYCIAGFIEPPLIREEADRTSPAQIVVGAIHPVDRQRYFDLCQGAKPDTSGPDNAGEGGPASGSGDQAARVSVDATEWNELTAKVERGVAAAEYVDGLHSAFADAIGADQPTDVAGKADQANAETFAA